MSTLDDIIAAQPKPYGVWNGDPAPLWWMERLRLGRVRAKRRRANRVYRKAKLGRNDDEVHQSVHVI